MISARLTYDGGRFSSLPLLPARDGPLRAEIVSFSQALLAHQTLSALDLLEECLEEQQEQEQLMDGEQLQVRRDHS
jgi:hypothetical protein